MSTFILKLKLFLGMLVAANTAATAIYMGFVAVGSDIDYMVALVFFLLPRVVLFISNPNMPLIDNNVSTMSYERTLWNLCTILVLWTTYGVVQLAKYLQVMLGF